jgi:CheB methylesterase
MSRSEDPGLEVDSAAAEQNAKVNEPDGHSPFPIVGIGASAGGLDAFQQLLAHLPADINMAFLLVQHLDATTRATSPRFFPVPRGCQYQRQLTDVPFAPVKSTSSRPIHVWRLLTVCWM